MKTDHRPLLEKYSIIQKILPPTLLIFLCFSDLEATQVRAYLTVPCVDKGNLVSAKVHFTHVQRATYISREF